VKYSARNLLFSFLLAFLIIPCGFAFSGVNDDAVFALDFKTASDDAQLTTTIDAQPEYTPVTVEGEARNRFAATVVLKNASNLLGVNCDLVFDKAKIRIVEIHEAKGDLNFDGRANVADVLTLGERFGQSTTSGGLSYFDLDSSTDSANKIDGKDIEAVIPYINEKTLYWTSNPNGDLKNIRESVELFESPEISNGNGKIDDIAVVLLSRIHPTPQGFGFDGDARIADIVFEIVPGATGETTISFEDVMAIDESTEITQSTINNGSTPKFQNAVISLP
jgi:hypothetical protein